MAPYPISDQQTTLRPVLSTPSLSSEEGIDLHSDHRPILERENDDEGPPPIQSPQHRNRLSLPPAPPTSRGNSFDEPLWIQNARSSPDLWLRGWWIEERFDSKDAPVAVHTFRNSPYEEMIHDSELLWDDEPESCATSIGSCRSLNPGAPGFDDAHGSLWSPQRRDSSTYSILTFQSYEEEQLSVQHRNFGTEDLRRLDEHRSPVKGGYQFRGSGNPIHTLSSTRTSPVVTSRTKADHVCYAGCITPTEQTISVCYHDSNDFAPTKDDLLRHQPRTAACKRDPGELGPSSHDMAEMAPVALNCSVWEDDEREGRWTRLAASFHPPNGPRRVPEKGGFRSRMSKLFKRLFCCSTGDET